MTLSQYLIVAQLDIIDGILRHFEKKFSNEHIAKHSATQLTELQWNIIDEVIEYPVFMKIFKVKL